jgi:hypothetical protein
VYVAQDILASTVKQVCSDELSGYSVQASMNLYAFTSNIS